MMPKRFRDRLALSDDRTVWITNPHMGMDHLEVRPASAFRRYHERISALTPTKRIVDFKRRFFGSAMEVEVDAAGRILIPAAMRARIGLTDKITFVGADDTYFELWSPDALDRSFEADGGQDDVFQMLAEAGL